MSEFLVRAGWIGAAVGFVALIVWLADLLWVSRLTQSPHRDIEIEIEHFPRIRWSTTAAMDEIDANGDDDDKPLSQ